jgi:hypothetical protein
MPGQTRLATRADALDGREAPESKYKPGQHVTLVDRRDVEAPWNGGYRVTGSVDLSGPAPRYRILSTGGCHGRWAEEGQLSQAFAIKRL